MKESKGKGTANFEKNMISKWPVTGVAGCHSAAMMNFLLTPPEPGTDVEALAFP